MSAAKPIHQYLLQEGFRHIGRNGYWCFMRDKPVARIVQIDEQEIRGEGVFAIHLYLGFPDDSMMNDMANVLCRDGLLRPQTADAADVPLHCYPAACPEQALPLLQEHMWQWFDVMTDADIMLDLIDYYAGKRLAPPDPFTYLPAYLAQKNIAIGECGATLHQQVLYLLFAGQYAAAEHLLLTNGTINRQYKKWNPDSYRLLLDSAQRHTIIVPKAHMAWLEKKKLATDRTW